MKNTEIKEISAGEAAGVSNRIPEFPETFSEEYFEGRCKGKEKLLIGSYLDGELTGYIVAYDKFSDRSFYCWMAGVIPDFRKKGILKELMNYLETWAKDKGYTQVKIKTRNVRREMLAFLVKHNFLFTKVIEYDDPKESRICLSKSI